MNRYNRYQNVNSYWYDEVPEHWKKTKNKYVFHQDKKVVGSSWEDYVLLTMGKSGVKPRDMEGGGKFPASFENYQVVSPNQIIFCLFDLDETPRTVGKSSDHGMITSAYDVFSTTSENDPQFWTYFYQMIDDHKGLRPYYTGLRKVVRSETFMGIEVFSPPIEEQKLISRYLDKKTSQIDSLVEKIQKKIELLKEQRTSLINHYVTKGLDPNAKMKDSGVDWIGEIPKHWKLGRFKYYISVLTDYTANGSFKALADNVEYLQEGYSRLVRLTDLREDLTNDGIYVSLESHEFLKKSELFGKEILIANVGAYTGLAVKMKEGMGTCTLGPNMFLVRNDESISDVDYVLYLLNSTSTKTEFDLVISSTAQPKINKDNLKNLVVPIPPKNEQIEISKSLMEKTRVFEETLIKNGNKVSLLKEYRQSLISSVVTGRIRVTEDMI